MPTRTAGAGPARPDSGASEVTRVILPQV
jgi:hypothetical protein